MIGRRGTIHAIVPVYGSPAWRMLPDGDPRREVAAVLHDAACWRRLCESPYLAEILAEWVEWDTRRRYREASWAVSEGAREMAARGWTWLSYAELEKRRRLTSTLPCGHCGTPVTLEHPLPDQHANRLPDVSWVRCPAHWKETT